MCVVGIVDVSTAWLIAGDHVERWLVGIDFCWFGSLVCPRDLVLKPRVL